MRVTRARRRCDGRIVALQEQIVVVIHSTESSGVRARGSSGGGGVGGFIVVMARVLLETGRIESSQALLLAVDRTVLLRFI